MPKNNSFIVRRLKSIVFAFKGAVYLLKNEASIQVQFGVALVVTVAGLFLKISTTEWILQCFAIGLVMGIEGINSAIEALADFVHPNQHKKIGLIKDIAAGAVFFAAVTAVIIGILIYFPKLF